MNNCGHLRVGSCQYPAHTASKVRHVYAAPRDLLSLLPLLIEQGDFSLARAHMSKADQWCRSAAVATRHQISVEDLSVPLLKMDALSMLI